MNKQYERYLKITLVALDLIALNLVFKIGELNFEQNLSALHQNAYNVYWSIENAGWLILCFFGGTYAQKTISNFITFLKRSTQIYILWIILLLCYLFFSRELLLSRLFIVSNVIGFGIGLLANRFLYFGITRYLMKSSNIARKVLILGLNKTSKRLTGYLEEEGLNAKVLGYMEDEEKIKELSHYPVIGGLNDTIKVAKELQVEEIYSTITPEGNNDIYDLMYQSEQECIRFKIVPDLSVFIKRDIYVEYFGDLPVLSLRHQPLDDVGNRFKKRLLDVGFSVLVIIFILSWLMPLLGLLIYLESGLPILFKQMRTGRNLKPFPCWKLRSMRVNKDAHTIQTTRNDKRITRIGKFIRKTSLDEFPQFINVLKGEMSLVGPRPHMLKHTDDYSQIVNEYNIRQFTKPGITGWAQINGYRGEITNTEQIRMRVNLDLWYLENWTLWLDIQILFLTVYKIIKGDKMAY